MLYVSTRDHTNTFTAHHALFEQNASDGGMFMPFRLPVLTHDDLAQMKSSSFGSNVARILNIFFSAQLTGWEIDFCCGRSPVDIISLPRKLLIAELWHNTGSSYAHMERALYDKLCGKNAPAEISPWARIAIRISVFFAIYAMSDLDTFDLAIDDHEFTAPLAAWYARRMGLPIGTIICGCNDNGAVWDLLHRGEMNTISSSQNIGIEQLICATLGHGYALQFVSACRDRRTYHVPEEKLPELSDRIFVAVTSEDRIKNVVTSVNRSNNYTLDSSAAISFGALQDYRARVGESRTTMLLSMMRQQGNKYAVNR